MIAEEFTNSLKMQILHDAKEHIKQNIEPKIKELNCRECNLKTYVIEDFSDDERAIIAHLKCANCGFKGDFTIHLDQSELDKGLNEVNTELNKFQNTIEDFNRRLNNH